LLLNQGKDLDAFIAAIQAGKVLQKHKAHDPEVMGSLITNIYDSRERNRLENHDDSVYSVSFSPDGKILASGSSDNTIKLWDVDLDFLMERSCNRIRNYLLYNPNVKDRDLCDGIGTEE